MTKNSIQKAYNNWANSYDLDINRTRDIEESILLKMLKGFHFKNTFELGCGTGKNTKNLINQSDYVLSIDFSEEMLSRAENKFINENIEFKHANILDDWNFIGEKKFDIAIFSLVLEHIENLESIFEKLEYVLKENGLIYIAELHPFRQLIGKKATFNVENKNISIPAFIHNISEYINLSIIHKYRIIKFEEHFDNDANIKGSKIPRIVSMLFQKTITD